MSTAAGLQNRGFAQDLVAAIPTYVDPGAEQVEAVLRYTPGRECALMC